MSAAADVHVTVNTDSTASETIDARFFGGNLLFDRDDLDGTFHGKVSDLNLNLLRFPGGGMAEDDFDITNPDATGVAGMEDHETLSNFLTYCAAQGITPAIVIPTKRYVDDIATGVSDVSAFVAAVTGGTYGPVSEVIFEIGNEFYATTITRDNITSKDYGAIASQFAVAIDEATLVPTMIAVQAGRSGLQNANIIAEFDTEAEIDAVNGIVVHQYPWTTEAVAARFVKTQTRLDEWEDAGIDALSFMSEWNVGSSPYDEDNPLHDYGLPQGTALLEIVHHAVSHGIDYGAVWGLQHTTKTALGRSEGAPHLLAAGMLYQMMSGALPGKSAMLDAVSYSAEDLSLAYSYEDDQEMVVFVAARDFDETSGPMTVAIDMIGAGADFVAVEGVKLSSEDPLLEPRPYGVSTAIVPELVFEDGRAAALVTFEKDYEIIRLTFAKPSTVMSATNQSGGGSGDFLAGGLSNDDLKGHKGQDFLSGHDGADSLKGGGDQDHLSGGGGNDILIGGSGADTLLGGTGNDQIEGQAGRDVLRGGTANDSIDGGAGRDFLYGDAGDDVLNGGEGRDRFWGGTGADTFVFEGAFGVDRIFDFEDAVDVIDLSALTSVTAFADLAGLISQNGRQVSINLLEGEINLRGFDVALIDADDFLF